MDNRTLARVFIVDQSEAIIERLAAALEGTAEVIGRATNAQDALEGIRNSKPHLAVVDVAIPDGIELLKQIKSHQPPVTVVVLTHSADETTRRVCLRMGAEYFLDKIRDFNRVREIVISQR